MGETTSNVPLTTVAPNKTRRLRGPLAKRKIAIAQNRHRYSGFTRNQQATPNTAPAPSANQMLLRFATINNSQFPPRTSQVVGVSAEGYAEYIANKGDRASRQLAATPTR